MDDDWVYADVDDFPRDHRNHYEVAPAVDGGVDAEGWERYTVVEERYRALEGGSITSWDSLPEADPVPPPGHRALSAFRWLRPHSPHGLSSVPPALRYARLRFTQGLSAGVRSIRRYLPTIVHIPLVRATRRTSPSLDRRAIPEWNTDVPATYTAPPLRSPQRSPTGTEECTACQVEILVRNEATRVPCGHIYHSTCLLTLVEVAMRTPSQFPPRCCRQPIPPILFRYLLDIDQLQAFTRLQVERATHRPLYCANPRCSRFLGERDKHTPVHILTCGDPACLTRTCARCKAAVGRDDTADTHVCAYDAGHRAVLQLGTRHGWVRCPGCEQLVERNGGCPHMTCRCGTEFCYACGKRYGDCVCGQRRTLYPVYAIPDPVFPEDPVGIPEPVRPRRRRPLPEPFINDYEIVPTDYNYEERPPMRTTVVAWTADERDMEAYPPYHAAGVHPWQMRPEALPPAIEEEPSRFDFISEISVSLPPSIAGSPRGSSEGHAPYYEEVTAPVSPASSVATGGDSFMGRMGEAAQQARVGSLRRASLWMEG
ncbi:hypothetical protein VTO73DRAFT_6713 [Trametes versicolor]